MTLGSDGVLICNRSEESTQQLKFEHVPAEAVSQEQIVSVVGAGDCLMAGFIQGLLRDLSIGRSIQLG